MSDSRDLHRLLQAARGDGPGASSRERIWEGVSLAPQLSLVSAASTRASESVRPGAGSGAAAIKAAAGSVAAASVGKLLLAGAVVGSALTLGLGALLLRGPWPDHVSRERSTVVDHSREPRSLATPSAPRSNANADSPAEPPLPALEQEGASTAELGAPRSVQGEPAGSPADNVVSKGSGARGSRGSGSTGAGAPVRGAGSALDEGDLSREIERVGQARRALGRGEPAAALVSLDAAARGGTLRFEPEELSLRVRALRMLGRTAEAAQVEATLRARFPDNFLAR